MNDVCRSFDLHYDFRQLMGDKLACFSYLCGIETFLPQISIPGHLTRSFKPSHKTSGLKNLTFYLLVLCLKITLQLKDEL